MKKLSLLQIFVVAGLVSNLTVQARQEMGVDSSADLVMQAEDAAKVDQNLGNDLIAELEKTTEGQQILEKIIRDESRLQPTFESVRTFIKNKIAELDKLTKQSNVTEDDVARVAEELADAQTMLDTAEVHYVAKYKRKKVKQKQLFVVN